MHLCPCCFWRWCIFARRRESRLLRSAGLRHPRPDWPLGGPLGGCWVVPNEASVGVSASIVGVVPSPGDAASLASYSTNFAKGCLRCACHICWQGFAQRFFDGVRPQNLCEPVGKCLQTVASRQSPTVYTPMPNVSRGVGCACQISWQTLAKDLQHASSHLHWVHESLPNV
jgi:hypothetical protein